jgi:alanyl aminopeptidase
VTRSARAIIVARVRTRKYAVVSSLAVVCALTGCADTVAAPVPAAPPTATLEGRASLPEPVPALRLPNDARPTAETLVLSIDPAQPRFQGTATIDVALDRARSVVWMHGRDLHVSRATLTPDGGQPMPATWEQKSEDGTSSLTLASAAPAGKVRVTIDYDAPFAPGSFGLYSTTQAGVPYAFTQFENIDARRAFPCFDEPGFKIPFSVSLVVPNGAQAISNAAEIDRSAASDGKTSVHFATTKPLPTYLVAFAVGPLDIVSAPDLPPNQFRTKPLPIRAIAAKGRGKELAYAVAHTGEIVATLERAFGLAYPYDKLDVLAVPARNGAMENAGAVMFDEGALLIDETESLSVKQLFAEYEAHELSHQWFGDLVTMQWWDDVWLNESFATWMGYKAADLWDPTLRLPMQFASEQQYAMRVDSLVSARAIRQPIVTRGDIENAFDSITYGKGGAVLGMFERWLGSDPFQRGVRAYLTAHAYGSATADDFLRALSTAAARDVSAPFRTFLDQPGVPFIEASVTCDGSKGRLLLKQSRFLPLGSKGDAAKTWQVPVCARYGVNANGTEKTAEACALLTSTTGDLALDACPEWVMPNAGGAGYYRFALAAGDLKKLRDKGLAHLEPRERLAYGDALDAAFNRVTTPFADLIEAAAPLVNDADEGVLDYGTVLPTEAHNWLHADPLRAKIEAYERRLAGGAWRRVGFDAKKGEGSAQTMLRRTLLYFLANDANDPGVRAIAKKHGLAYLGTDDRMHPEAIDANVASTSLLVVGQDADEKTWSTMLARLKTTLDSSDRSRLLRAMSASRNPKLAARARELVLGDVLLDSERTIPLRRQMSDADQRDAAWEWAKANFDAVSAKLKGEAFVGTELIVLAGSFCDAGRADEVETFLAPKLGMLDGGARDGAAAVERIRLCAAKRTGQEPSARAYFSKAK